MAKHLFASSLLAAPVAETCERKKAQAAVAKGCVEIVEHAADQGTQAAKQQIDVFLGAHTDFKNKVRPLSMALINDTGTSISLRNIEFDSGKLYAGPIINMPFPHQSFVTLNVCNVDGGLWTGVSGWADFEARDGTKYGLGFSCPYSGATKCKVLKSASGKKAWGEMTDCNNPGVGKIDDYKVHIEFQYA